MVDQSPAYVVVEEASPIRAARVELGAEDRAEAAPAPTPAPAAAAAAVDTIAAPALPQPPPRAPAAAEPFAASQQLALARHLSTATNGAAPLASRLESLSWLVFQCGRAQGRAIPTPHDPAAWLATPEALALLEQVYLVGGAVADLGVADGVYGGAGGALASNGQRAVVSLDFAALLTRYLGQHGMTLHEAFVAEIPYDWLQAKAIHVASCLETRCTIHRLVFERLMDRVGLEGMAGGHPAAAWGGATIINHNTTTSAAQGGSAHAAATAAPVQHGGGGPLQALFLAVWALAGGAVRCVAAVFVAAGGFLARLVVLRWFASAIGAVAAVAHTTRAAQGPTPQPQTQPGWAAAGPAAWPSAAPAASAPQPTPTHSSALPGPQSHPLALGPSGRTLSSEDEQQQQQQPLQQTVQQQQGQVPYFEALCPAAPPFPIAGALGLAASATAAAPLLPHHAALREHRKLSLGGQDSFDEDDWGR